MTGPRSNELRTWWDVRTAAWVGVAVPDQASNSTLLLVEHESRITLLPNHALLESWEGESQLDPLLVTLLCLAEWADRCAIWPLVGGGAVGYEGKLPADPDARHALLVSAWDDVRAYLDREYPGYRLIAAMLWSGDQVLLNP